MCKSNFIATFHGVHNNVFLLSVIQYIYNSLSTIVAQGDTMKWV